MDDDRDSGGGLLRDLLVGVAASVIATLLLQASPVAIALLVASGVAAWRLSKRPVALDRGALAAWRPAVRAYALLAAISYLLAYTLTAAALLVLG